MSEVDNNEPEVDNPARAVDNPADPLAAMRAMMTELLAPLQTQVAELVTSKKELEAENTRLREEAIKNADISFASDVPSHLRSDDRLVDPNRMSKARSVTIRTRPVVENPQDYQNVIDVGGLVQNTMEKIMGLAEDRENA